MPSDGKPVEVFIGPPPELSFVGVPRQIEEIEADPGTIAEVVDEDKRVLRVGAREVPGGGSTLKATLTFADNTRLILHFVSRPHVMDARLNIRERPEADPVKAARIARERLSRCQSGEAIISDKAKLIAERGSEVVINRAVGDGSAFKQTNQLSVTFVDVVHDAGISYATLVIKNRSDFDWPVVLEKIRLGPVSSNDVQIIARASELATIPPGGKSRVVLAYETPADPSTLVASLASGSAEEYSLFIAVIP